MTSNNQQEGSPFTLPTHLFNDPIALSTFLAENYAAETEVVAVSEENIQEMEAAAGFLMPEAYVDHWLEKGSIFFGRDAFVYALYCYNAEGVNGNNLYGFLTFWQNYKQRSFNLIEEEKNFLTKCCWVLAMIMNGEEMWMFVTDPLGAVHHIHFKESLRTISDEAFNQAVLPVLEAKTSLQAFMSTEAYLAAVETPAVTGENEEDEEDTSAVEEAETNAFLEKYGLKRVSYDEILTALNVDQLFDYWEDGAENTYAYNYENERDYFDNLSRFYLCDGDLYIDGDLEIPHSHIDLLVVSGNMTVNGKVAAQYSEAIPFYVTGNTTVDHIDLGFFQKTLGQENVRYVASAWGRDDEAVHTMPFRSINAPYFFSWFYNLACFEFMPNTIITALYNNEELAAYETKNVLLAWHDYAYAFLPDLYYNVSELHYDVLSIGTRKVYETLKNNQPVFQQGVTPEAIQLTREGLRLYKEGDVAGAYQYFKDAFTKAPGYYPAYYHAGKCLADQKAYAQATALFAKGIPCTPEKLIYEVGCMEQAALCAVRTGEYDKAIEWAQMAVQKNESAAFSLRVIGEALIGQNKLVEAKAYLERSIEAKSIFTNNWLLGSIYYLQGDQQTAEQYYQTAAQKNSKAQPYTQHTSLHYLYGDNITVNWDIQKPASKVKDQAYWNQFFAEMLEKYGPDMYKKTGKFPFDWLAAKLNTIPEQYRSKEMLQALLDHKTEGAYDVDGQAIRYFKPELYTQAIILQAVKREGPCEYKDIPAQFITAEVWENHPRGIDLTYVPAVHLTYELCFRAVTQSQYNYKLVPAAFRDERMNIALIAGGCLKPYPVKELPSKYYTNEYIKQAVELGIQVIGNIPVKLVDTEVYEYAAGRYGQEPQWPLIVKQYDRQGHEFSYDTFDKVWACFWDEAFIIKALTANDRNSSERIYDLPKKYLTQKICDIAVQRNSYDFQFVPKQFVTQEMCEKACSADYGSALEFVPLEMRTQKVCEMAVGMDAVNIKFVPLQLRTQELCAAVITRNKELNKYVPHELYTQVFEILAAKFRNRFKPDYLLLNQGLGLVLDKNYEEARKKLTEVGAVASAEPVHVHQSIYYIGFSYFLEADNNKAKEYFRQSQDIAKAQKIGDADWLTYPYATFQLPVVADVYEFSKETFDEQMHEATLLVQIKEYPQAIDILARAEKLLTDAQCTEISLWAYVWDHQRYALYEAGKKEESLALCKRIIAELSKITLWDYLEVFNPVRGALRSAHNSLAYRCYETATDLKAVEEGIKHIKVTMKTIAPIEDKSVLNVFYETQALLFHKAMGFDAAYEKDFEKVVTKISKLKLKEAGLLSNEIIQVAKL